MNTLRIGFGRRDITPRVGVELAGFGPFLCRHSDGVRDRLWARAVAFDLGGERAVLVSCDLLSLNPDVTARTRALVGEQTGLPPERVMTHATHTHSGPALRDFASGWGQGDPPYIEILPTRIAQACCSALENLREATLSHAEVPCEGIAINRVGDAFQAKTWEEVLDENWRPAKPELTDPTAHVFRVDADGRMLGFWSYYSCHPVIGAGAKNRKIHGDWPGLATSLVERLHPDATGFFLQGAHADINACRVSPDEVEAMRVLDVISARYARVILAGLAQAQPLAPDRLAAVRLRRRFAYQPFDRARMEALLAEQERTLHAPDADDSDHKTRMAMVYARALRLILQQQARGEDLSGVEGELQGLRVGPVSFLGACFEIFNSIKREVSATARARIPLVMSQTNFNLGYATDRAAAAKGGYEADMVPFIGRRLPFANVGDELTDGLKALDAALYADEPEGA